MERLLRAEVERYHGVPHRMGGTDERGFDCSGLMLVLYRDLFAVTLPRTTTEQAQVGHEVAEEELRAGDLVFFRPSKTQHVGVYVGNGEFAHASSSSGVMISRLEAPYWQQAYWTSRRLSLSNTAELERPAAHQQPRRAGRLVMASDKPENPPDSDGTSRAGW